MNGRTRTTRRWWRRRRRRRRCRDGGGAARVPGGFRGHGARPPSRTGGLPSPVQFSRPCAESCPQKMALAPHTLNYRLHETKKKNRTTVLHSACATVTTTEAARHDTCKSRAHSARRLRDERVVSFRDCFKVCAPAQHLVRDRKKNLRNHRARRALNGRLQKTPRDRVQLRERRYHKADTHTHKKKPHTGAHRGNQSPRSPL
ncbi:hypothetical protein BC628DRAFT_1391418 [Trametes gibbosa]|nr:hypothetical protein BC628DRAFT_1391418 [Trametes gibbosa]